MRSGNFDATDLIDHLVPTAEAARLVGLASGRSIYELRRKGRWPVTEYRNAVTGRLLWDRRELASLVIKATKEGGREV